MYDILLRGAMVYDGTGAVGARVDIAIKDGVIHEMGHIPNTEAARDSIDAGGLVVAPGFIDVNNHSDTHWRLFSDPDLESLVRQGITTIVGGTCGSSIAPLINNQGFESIRKWIDVRSMNVNWRSVEELFVHLASRGMAINFATLAGHSTIRRALIGDEHRPLSAEEREQAKDVLEVSMEEGALGASLGLAYAHARAADDKEIRAILRSVAQKGGIVSAHLRDETAAFDHAVREMIEHAKASRTRLHLTHLKAMGKHNWEKFDGVLSRLVSASKEGVSVSFDVFPYTYTGSVLYIFLPDWASVGGRDAMLGRLRDASSRRQIVAEMKKTPMEYENIQILSATFLDRSMTKKSIAEIARARGVSPEEAVVEVLLSSEGRAIARMDVLDEANVEAAIRHPLSMVASDGSGYSESHKRMGQDVHPRCFGAFPRFLGRYVRKNKLLSWEEAIYKITGFPAKRFGIRRRGVIKEGNYADVVVFDPEAIRDKATVRSPFRYAEGIEHLIVNGTFVLKNGKYESHNAGALVRRGH